MRMQPGWYLVRDGVVADGFALFHQLGRLRYVSYQCALCRYVPVHIAVFCGRLQLRTDQSRLNRLCHRCHTVLLWKLWSLLLSCPLLSRSSSGGSADREGVEEHPLHVPNLASHGGG